MKIRGDSRGSPHFKEAHMHEHVRIMSFKFFMSMVWVFASAWWTL